MFIVSIIFLVLKSIFSLVLLNNIIFLVSLPVYVNVARLGLPVLVQALI
jgi:hypothetical protein